MKHRWMKQCICGFLAVLLLTGACAAALPDDNGYYAGASQRKETLNTVYFNNPFPNVDEAAPDAWAYWGWALSAMKKDTATANQRISEALVLWPPAPVEESVDASGSYFQMLLMLNLVNQYKSELTEANLAGIKEYFYTVLYNFSTVEQAQEMPGDKLLIEGSENHDMVRRTAYFLGSQLLVQDAAYRSRVLRDGHTVSEHFAAWNTYMSYYFEQKCKYGLIVEIGSPTYTKYTLGAILDICDFALSERVRRQARVFLDAWFADMAQEYLAGVRGGGKNRVYKDKYSYLPSSDFVAVFGYLYFGDDMFGISTSSIHPGQLIALHTNYVPPAELVGMVDYEQRGSYMYRTRIPAEGVSVDGVYQMELDSHAVKTTYVTPSYIMGAELLDRSRQYVAINTQNRWQGIIMRTTSPANNDNRIYFQCEGDAQNGRTAYDETMGLVNENKMIVQRQPTIKQGGAIRTYVSSALYAAGSYEDGWFFTHEPSSGTYAAIRPSRGQFDTDIEAPLGRYLTYTDNDAPILTFMGTTEEYASFDAFKQAAKAVPVSWAGDTLVYGEIFFYATGTTLPMVNGQTVDTAPQKLFDSPYLSSVWGSGVFELSAPDGRTRKWDVNLSQSERAQEQAFLAQYQ